MYNNSEYNVCPCCRNMVRRNEGRLGLGGLGHGFGHGFGHGLGRGFKHMLDHELEHDYIRDDIKKYRFCPYENEKLRSHERERSYERENYSNPSYYNSYNNYDSYNYEDYSRENYEETPSSVSDKKGHVVLLSMDGCPHCDKMTHPTKGSFGNIEKLERENPHLGFHNIEIKKLDGYNHHSLKPDILRKIKEEGKKVYGFPTLKFITQNGDVHELNDRDKFVEEANSKLGIKLEKYEEESMLKNHKHKNHHKKKHHIVLYHWKNCGHCYKMTKPGGSYSDVNKLCKEHPDFIFHCIETEQNNNYSHPDTEEHILQKIREVGKKLNAFPVIKLFTEDDNGNIKEIDIKDRDKFVEEARSKLGNKLGNERREHYEETTHPTKNNIGIHLFHAKWCPHCVKLNEPGETWHNLEKLERLFPEYTFHKHEEKEFNNLPEHIKKHLSSIKGFPTVLAINKHTGEAQEVDRNLKNLTKN